MSATGDPRTDRMVPVALRLIGAVREFDADEVALALQEAQLQLDGLSVLAVTLAAMVPYDHTAGDLLGWVAHREEFERLVAIGIDPATAATLIEKLRKGHGYPE